MLNVSVINNEQVIETRTSLIKFDTPEFVNFLNDYDEATYNEELGSQFFTFIINSLYNEQSDKDFYSNSSEAALNYLLHLRCSISDIHQYLSKSNNYFKLFSYIRRFLNGYKMNHEKDSFKHKVLIIILKILIKFLRIKKFYYDLVNNVIIRNAIDLLKQIKDNFEMKKLNTQNSLETFEYLCVFIHKFLTKSNIHMSEECLSSVKISFSIIDNFKKEKFKYSASIVLSSLLSISSGIVDFRAFRYFQSNADTQLIDVFIQLLQSLVIGAFKNGSQDYEIIVDAHLNNQNYEYNKCFNLLEIIISFQRFVHAINSHDSSWDLKVKFEEINEKIEKILSENIECLRKDVNLFEFFNDFKRLIQIDFDSDKDLKTNVSEISTLMQVDKILEKIRREKAIENKQEFYNLFEKTRNSKNLCTEFLKEMIFGLNKSYKNIEILYEKREEVDFIDKLIFFHKELKETNELKKLTEFLLLKIYLRKRTQDADKKLILFCKIKNEVNKSENILVKKFFTFEFDDLLIKELVKQAYLRLLNIETEELFTLNSFETYEYFIFIFESNTNENLFKSLRVEINDKKCIDLVLNDLESKYDSYMNKNVKKIEYLYVFRAVLKLTLTWLIKFNIKIQGDHTKRFIKFLASFELPQSSELIFEDFVVELKQYLSQTNEKVQMVNNKCLEETEEEAIKKFDANLNILKSAIENVGENYEKISYCLNALLAKAKYLNEENIRVLDDCEINKILFYLIQFYFEYSKQNQNLNSLLENIFFLLEILAKIKAYNINSFKNADNSDLLDILISNILIEYGFYSVSGLHVKLFFHLLYALSTTEASIEIVKVKFKIFNVYFDILRNIKQLKNFNCLNLIFMVVSNLIDESVCSELITRNNFHIYSKEFIYLFLHSIHNALYSTKKVRKNGKLEYVLMEFTSDYIETSCDLSVAITSLATFIEINQLFKRQLCIMCIEDRDLFNMFTLLIQLSLNDDEILAGLHILWLLLGQHNKIIDRMIKKEVFLLNLLKQWNENHNYFEIKNFSGSILWLLKNLSDDEQEVNIIDDRNLKYSIEESPL